MTEPKYTEPGWYVITEQDLTGNTSRIAYLSEDDLQTIMPSRYSIRPAEYDEIMWHRAMTEETQ